MEKEEEILGDPKITVVCEFCKFHNSSPIIEIDFASGLFCNICPKCRKENRLKFREDLKPFPKIRVR
jgi:hypothetical protein|tara:strand:+ start:4806 stop:5006 length:201 start_codon:yes stop_codon:yes gene_type:complete